jgi:hypothetical protein
MKVSREVASQRIDEYMVRVLMPRLGGSKDDNTARFKIGVAHIMGWLRITDEQFADMKDGGLVDGEGNIDMELVRKAVNGGLAALSGGELFVKKLSIWLSADDLSDLVDYVETGVQKQA